MGCAIACGGYCGIDAIVEGPAGEKLKHCAAEVKSGMAIVCVSMGCPLPTLDIASPPMTPIAACRGSDERVGGENTSDEPAAGVDASRIALTPLSDRV